MAVRFTTITASSSDQLREAVLEDLEVLAPGMRVLATTVPTSNGSPIDMIAADQRGRLVLVAVCLKAGAEVVARGLEQWTWTCANLGLLRALAPSLGLDLSQEPRLVVVAHRVDDGARLLAGCIACPEIEMHEATLVSAGGSRGVLLRSSPPMRRPLAATGIDAALAALPPGETRSLMRRVIEELRDAGDDGGRVTSAWIAGGLDLRRGGRALASLVSTEIGLELRSFDPDGAFSITSDADCREAARTLHDLTRSVPNEESAQGEATPHAQSSGAVTAEEIAEFGRLERPSPGAPDKPTAPADPPSDRVAESQVGASGEPSSGAPPAVRIAKTGFLEN